MNPWLVWRIRLPARSEPFQGSGTGAAPVCATIMKLLTWMGEHPIFTIVLICVIGGIIIEIIDRIKS
jgi:hypothetical protein